MRCNMFYGEIMVKRSIILAAKIVQIAIIHYKECLTFFCVISVLCGEEARVGQAGLAV